MPQKDKDAKVNVTTVRLNDQEDADLKKLAQFFGSSSSDVLVDGMLMVRDLKQVIEELIKEDPELANVLKNSLLPSLVNAKFRREQIGKVAEKVLVGLMKKDMANAGRRVKLILKLFQTENKGTDSGS